jgi:GntR family transcriptional regulator of vanillate catabolism
MAKARAPAADETKALFSSTVLARVRELIVTGEIPAGSHLAAEPIASRLGVSRTPVRAAFSVLLAEGLLEHSLNRGFSVRELTARDVLGAIDLRAAIEGRGAAMSVEYGWGDHELATLDGRIADGARIVEAGAWSVEIEREWYMINRDIHAFILRMAHNVTIRSTIRMTLIYPLFGDTARLCPAIARYVPQRHRQVPDTAPAHIVASQRDHEAIADAIRADDPIEAERLMRAHVLAVRDRLALLATRR